MNQNAECQMKGLDSEAGQDSRQTNDVPECGKDDDAAAQSYVCESTASAGNKAETSAENDHQQQADNDDASSEATFGSLDYNYGGVFDCGEEPVFGEVWMPPICSWASSMPCSPADSSSNLGSSSQVPVKNSSPQIDAPLHQAPEDLRQHEARGSACKLESEPAALEQLFAGSCAVSHPGRRSSVESYQLQHTNHTFLVSSIQHPLSSVMLDGESIAESHLNRANMSDLSAPGDTARFAATTQPSSAAGDSIKTHTPASGSSVFCCNQCGVVIMDREMLYDGESTYWHDKCVKCCRCGATMTGNEKFQVVNGRVYCEFDYNVNCPKPNQTRCHKCSDVLAGKEAVQEALFQNKWVFMHERCFVCDVCSRPLQSGTHYTFYHRWMVCEGHFERHGDGHFMHEHIMQWLDSCSVTSASSGTHSGVLPAYQPRPYEYPRTEPQTGVVPPPFSRYSPPVSEPYDSSSIHDIHTHRYAQPFATGSAHSIPDTSPGVDMLPCHMPYPHTNQQFWMGPNTMLQGPHGQGMTMGGGMGRPLQPKPRRSRTSFTDEQHRILLERFEDDPTPDSSDLEKIGRECDLPKRTVQIWFQNARARSKKGKTDPSPSGGKQQGTPKVSSAHSASPASTPSAASVVDSLTSHASAQSALTPTSHPGNQTTPLDLAASSRESMPSPVVMPIRSELAGTPLSVDRSPLSLTGQQQVLPTPDWPSTTISSSFEHIDYFNSTQFTASSPDLLPFGFGNANPTVGAEGPV